MAENFFHDDEGVLCAITTFDQDQNVISNTSYTYDDNGNMISYITVSMEDGSTLNSGEFVYDEKGNLLIETI